MLQRQPDPRDAAALAAERAEHLLWLLDLPVHQTSAEPDNLTVGFYTLPVQPRGRSLVSGAALHKYTSDAQTLPARKSDAEASIMALYLRLLNYLPRLPYRPRPADGFAGIILTADEIEQAIVAREARLKVEADLFNDQLNERALRLAQRTLAFHQRLREGLRQRGMDAGDLLHLLAEFDRLLETDFPV